MRMQKSINSKYNTLPYVNIYFAAIPAVETMCKNFKVFNIVIIGQFLPIHIELRCGCYTALHAPFLLQIYRILRTLGCLATALLQPACRKPLGKSTECLVNTHLPHQFYPLGREPL